MSKTPWWVWPTRPRPLLMILHPIKIADSQSYLFTALLGHFSCPACGAVILGYICWEKICQTWDPGNCLRMGLANYCQAIVSQSGDPTNLDTAHLILMSCFLLGCVVCTTMQCVNTSVMWTGMRKELCLFKAGASIYVLISSIGVRKYQKYRLLTLHSDNLISRDASTYKNEGEYRRYVSWSELSFQVSGKAQGQVCC